MTRTIIAFATIKVKIEAIDDDTPVDSILDRVAESGAACKIVHEDDICEVVETEFTDIQEA